MTPPERHRLIAFDVDGVIIRGFWLSQIIARLGVVKSFVFGVLGILYEARLMEVASFMRYSYKLLEGSPKDWLLRMTNQSSIIRGVRKTLRILRKQGHIIILLSSGIPDFAVSRLAKNVGAHFASGIRVEVENGLLTGHIAALDCQGQTKVEAIQHLIEIHHLENFEIVAVANDRNNIPLFNFAQLAVGFRPDRVARRYVRRVVTTQDLRALLPIISFPEVREYIPRSINQEIIRQLIHSSAVLIPFLWLSDPSWHFPIYSLIGSLSLLFIISEILRSYGIRLPLIAKIVQAAGREDEIGKYALSPLYFAVGVAFPLLIYGTLLLLPHIAVASVSVFVIGDSFATIGGLVYGRNHYPFNKKKSIEGTLTGFSLVFLLLLTIVTPLSAFLCAVIGGLIELLPFRIDDNLTIPLLTGAILTILQVLGLYVLL